MQGLNKTVKKKGKFVMEYKKIEKPEINLQIPAHLTTHSAKN